MFIVSCSDSYENYSSKELRDYGNACSRISRLVPKTTYKIDARENEHRIDCELYFGNGMYSFNLNDPDSAASAVEAAYLIEHWDLVEIELKKCNDKYPNDNPNPHTGCAWVAERKVLESLHN